jgi:hypothetical protein
MKTALLTLIGVALFTAPAVLARTDHLVPVDSIWVDANICATDIENELSERGFLVTGSPAAADASLIVDVYDHASYVRDTARFKATLESADQDVLMTASGTETARSMGGLCDYIGDSIADELGQGDTRKQDSVLE